MIGLGTLINVAGIVVGGLLGLAGGRFLTTQIQDAIMKSTAVCVIFVGIAGAIEQMMSVHGAGLTSGGTARIVISMAGGALIGELLGIERGVERFGSWLKRVTGNGGDATFVNAFVTASLTVCIGAMAVVGSIQDGLTGAWGTLALKGALDLLIICVMTASLGRGCIFSAIPVGLCEGAMTLAASALQPLMTDAAINSLAMVGSILIFCVGVNLIWERTFRVANMLPALLIAVALAYL